MKKYLIVLMIVASFALVSCKEAPEVSISKNVVEMDYKGGSFSFDVTSNCKWELICDSDDEELLTISQWDGEPGTTTVTVDVDKNLSTSILKHYLTAVASNGNNYSRNANEAKSALVSLSVTQGAPAFVKFNKSSYKVDYIGGKYKFTVNTNFPWEIEVQGEGIQVEPTSGEPIPQEEEDPTAPKKDDTETDAPGTIYVTIDEYEGDVERDFSLLVTARGNDAVVTDKLTITQERPEVSLGSRVYRIKKMGDGRWWMIDNLCYSTKGITINDGKCGIWYPCADSGNKADETTAGIVSKGLLYSDAVAFNTNITRTTAKKQEGAQGICPDGWHIPTLEEYMALVGKCVNPKVETDTEAPYYDAAKDCGSLQMLKDAGFVSVESGYIRGVGAGYKKGALTRGYSSSARKVTNTYFFCSNHYTDREWYVLALDEQNGTANVDKIGNYQNDYPYAGSVRCIKNKK